jgi:hypothetical protein
MLESKIAAGARARVGFVEVLYPQLGSKLLIHLLRSHGTTIFYHQYFKISVRLLRQTLQQLRQLAGAVVHWDYDAVLWH